MAPFAILAIAQGFSCDRCVPVAFSAAKSHMGGLSGQEYVVKASTLIDAQTNPSLAGRVATTNA